MIFIQLKFSFLFRNMMLFFKGEFNSLKIFYYTTLFNQFYTSILED